MAKQTSRRVAAVYAEALYEAAAGANAQSAARADVESLQKLLQEYPKFGQMLADPKTSIEARDGMVRRTFEGRVEAITLNFLLVLSRRWRMGDLGAILDSYVELDNVRRLGRREVEVISATDLDGGMLEQIRQGIASWGGFEPVVRVKQDASLLGGLMIRIGDQQVDATVKGQLERLREQLKKGFEGRVTEVQLET
jgi:F-type H+-transporting ATPase subunit delta